MTDPSRRRVPVAPVPDRARRLLRHEQAPVVAVVALGGVLGSLGRSALSRRLPHPDDRFPWATFIVNVSGSLLIGVLIVFVVELPITSRYARPFLGTGVLGGWTTFSTYMLDTHALLLAGRGWLAAGYLVGTTVVGLAAAVLGVAAGRVALRAATPGGDPSEGRS